MKKIIAAIAALSSAFLFVTACSGGTGSGTVSANASDGFDKSRVISVYTREDGSGTRDAFVSLTGVGDDMYEEAIILGSTNEIRASIESNEYAIGYISVGSLNNDVKALTVGGVAPSDETIKDGSYTLQRPLLVCVTPQKAADPLASDFISYMLSSQGQVHSGSSWTAVSDNAPAYEPAGLSGELRIGGSTSVEPLIMKMAEEYKSLNPGVTIDVSATGSGAGISGAAEGELDIGMSSRELREGELENLTPIVIALDGVAVIVHPANPVSNMTIEQIKDIFTGAATTWANAG